MSRSLVLLGQRRAASKRWKEKQRDDPRYQEQCRLRAKQWWDKNGRDLTYRRKYGITAAEFDARVAAQNYRCPIGNHLFGSTGKAGSSPALDHDHRTGKHRDIICRTHNGALGGFHDSVVELESAIEYIKKHQGEIS